MRSKRLHSVLANSRMLVAAKHTRIQQQQAVVNKKLGQAHVLLESDSAPLELKMLMSAHVRNALGRSRLLEQQVNKSQNEVLKAAQLEAGAKRRHQRHRELALKEEGRRQMTEIIDTFVGKPPTSQY
ncbi:MAG: hypothetical protein GY947_20625 [Rhodobacteraceae bacterium]|nr:hypothetical protein [Paracoccaceae bacterium]